MIAFTGDFQFDNLKQLADWIAQLDDPSAVKFADRLNLTYTDDRTERNQVISKIVEVI
jgi:hypothetical protein